MDTFWAIIGFMSAEEWQAAGTVGTFVVAAVAALYAGRQVGEARRTREERARPYVAVYLELVGESTLDLVVKNFGATTARNITIASDIPMKRVWAGETEELLTFDVLPVLVPGQDWRTLFDVNGQRMNKDDDVYTVTVQSEDSRYKRLPEETFVLDWHTFQDKQYLGQKTLDDIGKALEKIANTLPSWSDGVRGLSVVSRDGDAKDRRWEEQRPQREARRAQAQALLRPSQASGTDAGGEPQSMVVVEPPKLKRPRKPKTPAESTLGE